MDTPPSSPAHIPASVRTETQRQEDTPENASERAKLLSDYLNEHRVRYERLLTKGGEQKCEGALLFQKPRLGLSLLTAWLWIYSRRLLGVAGSVAGLVILTHVLLYYFVELPRHEEIAARTREAQAYLADAKPQVPRLIAEARATLQTFERNLQGSTELDLPALTDCANVALTQLTPLAEKLTRAETRSATALATASSGENLEQLTARVSTIQDAIKESKSVGQRVSQLSNQFQALLKADRDLNRAWKQCDDVGAPLGLKERIMLQRDAALEEIGRFGDPIVVQKAVAQIEVALTELQDLARIPSLIKEETEKALRLAQETKIRASILQTSNRSLNAAEHGNRDAAKQELARLQDLINQLDQTFTLRIVNRPAEYSRIWYNNATHTGKLYYAIVEAVAPNGQIIPMEILSEQDGSSRVVNCWAERVDEATYEAVGADKKDDGIIQHDVFGKKERGYLTPHYLMGGKKDGGDPSKGRLNRWPRK